MQVRALVVVLSILFGSLFAVAQMSTDPAVPSVGVSSTNPAISTDPTLPSRLGSSSDARSFGTITGSVLTLNGQPVRNTQIELHDVNTGSIVATGYTKINGAFQFSNVPYGQYEVVASHGVDTTQQRVRVDFAPADVTLRLNVPQAQPGSSNTVSVTALRVPEKAQNEFRKAKEAFEKKKYDESEKHIDNALRILPNYAQALTLRGLLKVNKGDLNGGQQDFQSAITTDSNYAMGYFAMGAVLNSTGKYTQAQRTLEQGLRIDPVSWQGYFELSKSVLGQHDFRNALKYVVKAESFGPVYAPIHLVKAHALLGLKDYDEAAAELEQYLSKGEQGPEADDARRALNQAKAFSATAQK